MMEQTPEAYEDRLEAQRLHLLATHNARRAAADRFEAARDEIYAATNMLQQAESDYQLAIRELGRAAVGLPPYDVREGELDETEERVSNLVFGATTRSRRTEA